MSKTEKPLKSNQQAGSGQEPPKDTTHDKFAKLMIDVKKMVEETGKILKPIANKGMHAAEKGYKKSVIFIKEQIKKAKEMKESGKNAAAANTTPKATTAEPTSSNNANTTPTATTTVNPTNLSTPLGSTPIKPEKITLVPPTSLSEAQSTPKDPPKPL